MNNCLKFNWDNFGLGMVFGYIVAFIFIAGCFVGEIPLEYGTLNQICADYNGPQYMFNSMTKIDNAPDIINCKLRPIPETKEAFIVSIVRVGENKNG